MRFDTLFKKPKLWNVAVTSVLMIVFVALLYLLRPEGWQRTVGIGLMAYLMIVIGFLIRGFFRQLRYNPYSYNTIYYSGFAIFLLSILVTHVIMFFTVIQSSEEELWINMLYTLVSSPKQYMLYSAPLVLVLSVALLISNISLLIHEGRRIVNFLGILLAFLMLGGEVFLFTADYYASGSFAEVLRHELLITVFSVLYLYYECMVIGSMIANLIVVKYKPDPDKDFIIVLGCSIRKDGTPTPLLKGRLDRAIAFYREQLEKTGKQAFFITSGGQGSDEVISESECMKNYLLAEGIPKSQIIEENESTSTAENMQFSKEKILAVNPDGKILFSTTNFHVFRSGLLARRVKMRAQGIGCKTKWYFWPNSLVREFVGMLVQHRGKQILILLSMIAIYVLMILAYYEVWI